MRLRPERHLILPTIAWIAAWVLGWQIAGPAHADEIHLKDGMVIEGVYIRLPELVERPTRRADAGKPMPKPILLINDDLTRTFVHNRQVADIVPSAAFGQLQRFFPNKFGRSRRVITAVGPAVSVTPFDEFGRRTITMAMGKTGQVDMVQAITEIDPRVATVRARHYEWQTRVATASIPTETLDKMLRRLINPDNADQRLSLATFYIQGGYYREAREELQNVREQFGEEFPEIIKRIDATLAQLRQSQAREVVAEIELRSRAGQHHRAVTLLQQFPEADVAETILQQVSDLLDSYKERLARGRKAADLLQKTLEAVPQGELRAAAQPMVERITEKLNIENLARLEAFLALAETADLEPSEKLALALTGWLMGSDAAETELRLGLSLWHARDLVFEYLREEQYVRRQELLSRLANVEGISPERVAKIITQLPPPLAPEAIEPAQIHHMRVSQGPLELEYDIWLPPEYFTDRRYPAVVTLHGSGSTRKMQIDWWSSQAARHGYIVIAPAYAKAGQARYGFSAEEHAVVVASLRDALKRFQIDSDRVFLSGHSMGATAAWDIGLSHPHLFAGVIPISGYPDKYCAFYRENAEHLPFYVVAGQLDSLVPGKIATELDQRWMARNDVRYVEYIGRGHEHFREEIHRLFDWMNRRRRASFPTDFTCTTLRRSDDRFYWVQLDNIPPLVALPPPLFGKKDPQTKEVNGRVSPGGSVNVRGAGNSDATIWLAPELVDFNNRIQLRVNGKIRYNGFLEPSLHDMLEDVRVRGDRQRFYWKKYELAAGR